MIDKVQEEKARQNVIELCNSYPNELSDLAKTAVKDLRSLGSSWEYIELALTTKTEKDWGNYGFGLLFNASYKAQIQRALYKKHHSKEQEQELTAVAQEPVEQKVIETEKPQVDTPKKRSKILDQEHQHKFPLSREDWLSDQKWIREQSIKSTKQTIDKEVYKKLHGEYPKQTEKRIMEHRNKAKEAYLKDKEVLERCVGHPLPDMLSDKQLDRYIILD